MLVVAVVDDDVGGRVDEVAVDEGAVGSDDETATLVGVLVGEQELLNRSAAMATHARPNDRNKSLSPIGTRRELTG